MAEETTRLQDAAAGRRRLLSAFVGAAAVSMMVPPAVIGVAENADVVSVEFAPAAALEFDPLPERSELVGPDGEHLDYLYDGYNRRVVAWEDVPGMVWQAVLSAEDRRFFEHQGYDSRAITRAVVENLRAQGIVQGGSTITQQLAKALVGDEPTLERKGEELRYAVALEGRYDKTELLERYLNEAYFGAGAYGVAAAAEEFFDRSLDDLKPEQAALLAALIRAPSDLDPREEPRAVKQRRDAVLDVMAEDGYLDRRDALEAQRASVEVVDARERRLRHPDVVAAAQREFLENSDFGDSEDERSELLLAGGLQITTTIDVELQGETADLIREQFRDSDGVTAAVAAVEPATGAVLAAISGRKCDESEFNPALQARRQPGSAYKTFVLAAALEDGHSLDTRWRAPAAPASDGRKRPGSGRREECATTVTAATAR